MYRYKSKFGIVEITREALSTLTCSRQDRWYKKEDGGQLFGEFKDGICRVVLVTGAHKSAIRGRCSFCLPFKVEQQEIDTKFSKELHYLGDWHTHPQELPIPSSQDKTVIRKIFKDSEHDLLCMFLLVLGTSHFPEGIWFGCVSDSGVQRLSLVK